MLKRLLAIAIVLAAAALAVFWFLTQPAALSEAQLASLIEGDAVSGEQVFWAAGCASCHAAKGAKGDDKLLLGGGHELETPAGVFVSPNISPDAETGIGNWTLEEFALATWQGVSPDGSHYFPAFPYGSYNRMTGKDMSDLYAYMQTLPPVSRENEPHRLNPLFALRRGVGLWKMMFVNDGPIAGELTGDGDLERGRYLVEGVGHCGECHTPRSFANFGGLRKDAWLAGGPAPEGDGRIPNITPSAAGIASWSAGDIAYYLESGFTPDFDSVGGTMVSVQENMAKLPASDREAIAAYLKAVAPVE